MDTIRARIALGAILFLLLMLCHPYLSIADAIYSPLDLFSIDCGSSTNLSTLDGRNWIGDSNTKFLSQSHDTVTATPLTPSTQQPPYTSARLSHSQFSYSFPVTPGPKFLRLFFYSSSYLNFDRPKAYFSVISGPYTLLQHFNASLHADADEDPEDILFREYCINVEDGERLNITFTPSTTDSYAFINGIEIVSMPPYLYYTNSNVDNAELPQLVGGASYTIQNNWALETVYRLRVGDAEIPASQDTGMLRAWDVDNKYVTSQSVESLDFGRNTNLSFTDMTPNYTAPDQVYRSLRNMGPNNYTNMGFNLTWQLPVDSGFTYLLRLHFCQLDPEIHNPGDLTFDIFIHDQLAEEWADVLVWSGKQKGVPVVRDYAVLIPEKEGKAYNLSLKMHPCRESLIKDAFLNGIELFKINDSKGNLDGPNLDTLPETPEVPLQSSNKKSSCSSRTLAVVASAVTGIVLVLMEVRAQLW